MAIASGKRNCDIKYVYDLPYTERTLLCDILDINDQWKRLGGEFMGFSVLNLERIRRCGESPTDRLLHLWGQRNNTVLKLYSLLNDMKHFQAMNVLIPFVPERYHILQSCMFSDPDADYYPVPPLSLLQMNKHAVSENSPEHKEEATTISQLPHNPNMNYSSNSAYHDTSLEAAKKIPDSFLRHPYSLDTKKEVFHPKYHLSDVQHKQEKKIINTASKKTRVDGPPHSCDENISQHSKEDFDEEYRIKVEAKYGIERKEESRKEKSKSSKQKLSQGSTFPLPHQTVKNNSQKSESVQPNQEHPGNDRKKGQPVNGLDIHSDCNVPTVPYEELEEATHGWRDDHLLGKGGFGNVYKGMWKNTKVAIKRINTNSSEGALGDPQHLSQTLDELHFLQKIRHNNILQVFGFSADPGKPPCLVYEFMPFGSLEDRLQCRKIRGFLDEGISTGQSEPLPWRVRYNIAKGTSTALQFLHTVPTPVIHGDVKSANILLDKNYEPKLGDFGLAREGPLSNYTSMKVSRVHGTRPYIPDEYLRSKKLSSKVDTYSFGIVLFELCTGLKAYDERKTQYKFLKDLIENTKDPKSLMDKKAGGMDTEVFELLYNLGLDCVKYIPKERPDMKTVFKRLEEFEKVLKEQDQARSKRTSMGEFQGSTYLTLQPLQIHETFRSLSTSPSTNPSYILMPSHSPVMSHHASPVPSFAPHRSMFPPRQHYNPTYMPNPTSPYMAKVWRESVPLRHPTPASNHLGVMRPPLPLVVGAADASPEIVTAGVVTNATHDQMVITEEASLLHHNRLSPAAEESTENSQDFLPLLTELGTKKPSEASEKIVSGQGKSSFLDDFQDLDEDSSE